MNPRVKDADHCGTGRVPAALAHARRILCLFLLSLPLALIAGPFTGVEDLVARRVPWLQGRVRFERLGGATGDAFELGSEGGRLVIRASNANAAAAGLGWYLKYSCHRSISHTGDNLSPVAALPVISRPLRIDACVRYRYALNYCTYNYTMSFYSWKDWEHELDWMALSGVNLMLVANGEEAVWSNTLRRLGYTDAEIQDFIPGPGYTAWWLMGNLEGLGGPMTPAMIARRSDMQRRIIARMRSLGIEPVLPGFYGMVPANLKDKLKAHIVDQGIWGSFHRPGILDPTDPAFGRVAGVYYEELGKLYGPDLRFFSGDPFHEGGVMAGVDLGRAGASIQAAMQSHFPGAVWVLQGWIDNPRKELIASTDRSHVLVQELFGENTRNWETRRGYEGTPFVWCCIDDFGERPGLFGKLQRYADETYRARTGELGAYLQGVGIMPEGIDNNPVAYDIVLEMAWRREHVDAASWIKGYVEYRYGRADPDLDEAWALLLQTAYGNANDGIPENVLLSRPATPAHPVSTWGSLKTGYDTAVFARAVDMFARAANRFNGSETYRLDLIALRTQVMANEAYGVSGEITAALLQKNRPAFESAVDRFLRLGRATDKLQGTESCCRLGTYEDQALRYGDTPAEKRTCLRNALMLVTYWGGDDRNSEDAHDYAFKAWEGMMTSYYLKRWEMYFDYCRKKWDGADAAAPDFFAWERQWVEEAVAAGAGGASP
jgi:alpha-N-acetylglucosaminidase